MNVILVMSDTFRHDNLSCYGPARVKTPRLDAFARDAFVFENAYLGSFPTIPNRLDIMSGRFSCVDHEWCPLPAETVTLQQVLSASGVATQMTVDNPHLLEMGYDYSRGFDGWEWIRGQEGDHWRTAPRHIKLPPDDGKTRSRNNIVPIYARNTAWWQYEEDRFAPRTISAACKWLEENQDQDKFFLYVDLFDPHEPWDAPQKYVRQYDPTWTGEDLIYPNYGFWKEFLTPRELEHIQAEYMAEASLVDHWFGVLLDKLEELGMSEDTAVIFSSDHGYLFGEHDLTGKSLHPEVDGKMLYEAVPLYDEIRRIPLLIRVPGEQGQRVTGLVQAPDLMPTILELAGIVSTETHAGQSEVKALQCGVFFTEDWQFNPQAIHGKSLLPLMHGEVAKLRDIVVSSSTLVHNSPILAKSAIVTDDGWCLHYSGLYDSIDRDAKLWLVKMIAPEAMRIPTAPALFHLPSDPCEEHDVVGSNEGLARDIHARYVAWLEALGTPERHLAGRRRLA